ncbi:MAG: peptide chain release factor N(5)-glutamine methyltransferase [Syntrophomonadaceae bacterium]
MAQVWNIKELLEWTTRYFAEKGIEEPRLEAELLLTRVLHKDRVYLYTHYEAPVNQQERGQYRELIKRRVKGEPVAYILGVKEFMSLEFSVSPSVLIPRPETELLVEKALEILSSRTTARVCDIGTGSGAIAVSLAYYAPQIEVKAVDISAAALEIARQNAEQHGVKIDFFHGDLLEPFDEERFDLVVANLPYISELEYQSLSPEVRLFEPELALLGGEDGLEPYRRLISVAGNYLKPQGYILFEIGAAQGEAAREMLTGFVQVELIPDYAGHDRILLGRRD